MTSKIFHFLIDMEIYAFTENSYYNNNCSYSCSN